MFPLFVRRPVAAALGALAVASFGTAYAASDPPERERALPEQLSPAEAKAWAAQAKELPGSSSTTTRCCWRSTMR